MYNREDENPFRTEKEREIKQILDDNNIFEIYARFQWYDDETHLFRYVCYDYYMKKVDLKLDEEALDNILWFSMVHLDDKDLVENDCENYRNGSFDVRFNVLSYKTYPLNYPTQN